MGNLMVKLTLFVIVGYSVMTDGHSAVLGTKVGCLWVTLFGSSGCSVGFRDTPIGFGHSRVTGLLHVYNSSDAPKCVTDDPMGTRCSWVLWL